MSGPKHQLKPKSPEPQHVSGKVFGEQLPPTPPATKKVVECKKCFWGSDVSRGYRICRGVPPQALYRATDGNGVTAASALWPTVNDYDYCALGTLA